MDDKDRLLQKMRAGAFRENNGRVLRTINLLRPEYVKLRDVCNALPAIGEGAVKDSVNYMQLQGYIDLRLIETKDAAQLSDFNLKDLEGRVSGQGIKLLSGSLRDDDVIV